MQEESALVHCPFTDAQHKGSRNSYQSARFEFNLALVSLPVSSLLPFHLTAVLG